MAFAEMLPNMRGPAWVRVQSRRGEGETRVAARPRLPYSG